MHVASEVKAGRYYVSSPDTGRPSRRVVWFGVMCACIICVLLVLLVQFRLHIHPNLAPEFDGAPEIRRHGEHRAFEKLD